MRHTGGLAQRSKAQTKPSGQVDDPKKLHEWIKDVTRGSDSNKGQRIDIEAMAGNGRRTAVRAAGRAHPGVAWRA